MKITIEIPESFENEYNNDKFSDTFIRILSDLLLFKKDMILTGHYEIETLKMLRQSFEESEIE